MIGISCKGKTGKFAYVRFYMSNALLMADMILRHRARVAVNAGEDWSGSDAQEVGEFLAHAALHGTVVLLE